MASPGNVLPFDRSRSARASATNEPAQSLLRVWSSLGESKPLVSGQVLFLEGEPASHIYLVAHGRVESVHLSEDGRKFVSFEAAAGDVLGEGALIEGASYASSAQAASAAEVIRLRGDTVAALLREGGDFATALVAALSRRLCQTEQRAGQIALGGLEYRVASVLLTESERGSRVVQLTHREIAERSGAARESVTQTLNHFKREGMVTLTRGAIRVCSVARLAAFAGRTDVRAWLPLVKLLPALSASAAACAAILLSQPPGLA